MKKQALGEDRVGRLIASLSFPAMTGMMITALFALIDTFFVSLLGSSALAALTFCIPIEVLLTSTGAAAGMGITSLLSRTLGKKNYAEADNIAWHGLMIAVIYGAFFTWLGLVSLEQLLLIFGCSPAIFTLCRDYLFIILLGSIFSFIPMIASHIVQGEGNTRLPMLCNVVAVSLNVLLDPLLIFGPGAFPALGMRGAALATVLSQMISTVVLIYLMFKDKILLSWKLSHFRPRVSVVAGIYRVGMPSLIMELSAVFIMSYLNKVLVGYDHTAVAALGVFFRIRSIFYMPVYGLAQAAMPIAGFAYGARQPDRVKETIFKTSFLSFIILIIAWFIMHNYAREMIEIFSKDPVLISMGIDCLHLATLFLPIMGPIIILNNVLQALGKGTAAMYLSLLRQLGIFLPSLILLPHYFGVKGVWLAFSLTELLSTFVAGIFFINLWKQLQERKRYTLVMLRRRGYFKNRFLAWLKW
ncbi:MAG: MATE family efflux transporter [Syntrophomonadaceae bacterium]|nr:MATE family efflux transporter [Syntrophomonadaceae bacterium]